MEPPAIDRECLRSFRRVTVMGLGLFGGGLGAARYFSRLGAAVTVTDTAGEEALAKSVAALKGLDIRFVLGGHRLEDFTDTDLVVANQAVRPDEEHLAAARAAGVPVATETGLALCLNRAPWLGVTGSSGKSTTAALLAAMLERNDSHTLFGGNIGGDLITRVENRPDDAPLVVELSSFQLVWIGDDFAAGRIRPPRVAVLTNLTPNHLDWHGDMADYARSKLTLLRALRADGWAVLHGDDRQAGEWLAATRGRIMLCGPEDPETPDACFFDGGDIVVRTEGEERDRVPACSLRLIGAHNRRNALQAVAAAFLLCGDVVAVAGGLAAFPGLPHRLEVVGRFGGRVFVNDSKSTTPEAAITALHATDEPKVLIAGGYDKGSPFEELGEAVQRRAAALVLVGAAAGRLRAAVDAAARKRPAGMEPLTVIMAGDDFRAAVTTASRLAPVGGMVLLSPACASWGMFANYEERGQAFRDIAGTAFS